MADTQTSVVLNIGSQCISMAVFETNKAGGLVLKAYDTESVSADPALDVSRVAHMRVAITDLVNRMGLQKSKVRYAISGQTVFTRFVKLPPIQQDNIEQLVTFEAQQHVPFPLSEVVWDYELIDSAQDKEAVIVAIKSDALDEINTAVHDSGVSTSEVDVAPMATYNAFRSSYGFVDEPILLIDIGAKTSSLIYIEGKRFFTRSLPIGGSSITAAISKEYGVTFAEAEHQKISNGLVALGGGHTEQLDESVAALAMVIRNALTRLPAEIARTTNYYRSQHGGSAPRRILLAGGGANLPYTLEFFHEKLNLPVEYFNPVSKLSLGKAVNPEVIQRQGHTMGELMGLGIRAIGKSEINIDLVPSIVEQARADERRKPFLIAAAAVLILGVGTWAVMQNQAAARATELTRTLSEQSEHLSPLHMKIDRLLKKEAGLRKIADAYTQAENDHVFWLDTLSEVKDAFASDAVWLTRIDPLTGYNPALALEASFDPKTTGNGQAVVVDDVLKSKYGTSSFAKLKIATEEPKKKPKGKNVEQAAAPVMIDAVRIRGYWRDNPRSQNLVSDLLKQLRDQSHSFAFSIQDPKNKKNTINLVDDQFIGKIMTISTVPAEAGDLAQSFEITLPLVRKVAMQ